jgi:hypothetical protein
MPNQKGRAALPNGEAAGNDAEPLNKSNATPAQKNHAKAISSNSMLVSYHDFDVVVS